MDRSEGILALAKLLNSKIKRVPVPISKPESELVSKPEFVPKTLSVSELKARHFLEQVFLRNGYLRIRVRKKVKDKKGLGISELKQSGKGYEIRIIPEDSEELEMIRAAISELGLNVSNTFIKHNRIIQPIYGKQITLEFEKLRDNYRANNLKNGT